MKLVRKVSLVAAVSLFAIAASAKSVSVMQPQNLQWDQVTEMPPGAEVTVLSGDPEKPGPYVVRVKLPANYQIPTHAHHTVEYDTIIAGTLYFNAGNKVFKAPAGGFVTIPANLAHSSFTKEETILQVNGMGPWGMVYKKNTA